MSDLLDFEERARAVLPPHISAYYAAAGSGIVVAEGTADWSAVRFRPRVLRDVGSVSLSTTILGTSVRTPILVAPMAQQVGAHPDGEVAMGRAVAATGSLLAVSTNTGVPFASIARTGASWWFQVYVTRDHALTERLVERAVANGARALLLTVDMMAPLPSNIHPLYWPESAAKSRLVNLTPDEQAAAGPAGLDGDPSINFARIPSTWRLRPGRRPPRYETAVTSRPPQFPVAETLVTKSPGEHDVVHAPQLSSICCPARTWSHHICG